MLARLLVTILTAGATGLGLLVIRQQRIETVHEMALIYRRALEREQAIWRFRTRIHEELNASGVDALLAGYQNAAGLTLVPALGADFCPPNLPLDLQPPATLLPNPDAAPPYPTDRLDDGAPLALLSAEAIESAADVVAMEDDAAPWTEP